MAVVVLLSTDWHVVAGFPTETLLGLLSLTLLGLLSEASAFSYRFRGVAGSSSLSFLPLVAAVILFGSVAALGFIVVLGATGEFLIRRKPALRASFNTAQYINATAAGGWVFAKFGGVPFAFEGGTGSFDAQVVPVLAAGATILAMNHLAVATAIALSQHGPALPTFRQALNHLGQTIPSDLLVLPVAILVAFFYSELEVVGLVVALLPLVFIRLSYVEKYRLAAANFDLLQALVIAIEIRDPYTSGHSMRVRTFARRIGQSMGLSHRSLKSLESAALLHDIGKIEVAYEEILKKPESLSPKEREFIESHVTRGVEILKELTSLEPKVLASVRHHHEHFDGTGYPDQLAGKEIPIGARIIKLADAVDAMLSDRPYRGALGIEQVADELRRFKGRHFDPEIVEVVLDKDLLHEHVETLALAQALKQVPSDSLFETLPDLLPLGGQSGQRA